MSLFRLGARKAGKQRTGPADFGDLTEVGPVKESGAKLIANKAGRMVFYAKYQGRKIKAYQAHSPDHAVFLQALSQRAPELFPQVRTVRGAWVFADWVEGEKPRPGDTHHAADALAAVHALRPDGLPRAGFDYLEDFVIPRFLEAATLGGYTDRALSAVAEVRAAWHPAHVIHPDLTPDNIIVSKTGPVIIDNELVGLGNAPLLDLCNAVRPLDAPGRAAFVRQSRDGHAVSGEEVRVTALAWLMREAGSAFVAGRMDRCRSAMQALSENPEASLPVDHRSLL